MFATFMEKEAIKSSFLPYPDIPPIIELDPFLATLRKIEKITPLYDGVAHCLFRVQADGKSFFLKIRGDHFPRIPEIITNPEDIKNEYKALSIYGSLLPDNFPQVVSFNNNAHYLITSDATFNGELFLETLVRGDVTREIAFSLGRTLRSIHDSTGQHTEDLRSEGDSFHYDQKLLHRFGFLRNVGLDEMVQRLRQEERQLVLGDPAPKNIGMNNDGSLFVFFDLEDAHQGNPVFDYGYLLGHIILHNCLMPGKAMDLIQGYTGGYNGHAYDEDMVKKIALGTIRYRLAGRIPYEAPNIPFDLRSDILGSIENFLSVDLGKVNWDFILANIPQ
ncbi:MAG: hypothetical protein A3C30_02880 [Candidatus Levybacteria bacterium RIFCSPHIGHO2_02_FULL_40_18]|nr:MAG: hypothetical protein A2869_05100 [Candidatus Levybacteria bacterium RIFCSPHIGHO2_01_FULL_40_58]OGH26920.1 MAG: hypothetical protein A3C30_02880 [Candidatus Levybacteria bacterium RIFCSPHIGHO2_02_FULL_40_18]OGH32042.1 MAG: hypothetical protein A3E43_03860 [Candidatus Levybacteria bacterium RIFCSPHIGHO2_12_FULL_40_31]OGH40836.1 MAG: hypothetical protein A2894_04540 [Candidatus Levybacteria bacterium RIFCSPLOWO2_01_FULL_40_64]OGH48692.1 MAG: hypothetical protein A3I54_03470 [Candidatus Lev